METCRQMHLLTDKILRIPLLRTNMIVNILPLPIPVPTVYYYGLASRGLWVDHGVLFAGPHGLLCGMWAWGLAFGDPNWWTIISGFAWMGSFSGMLCVHVSWGLVDIFR